MSEPSGGSAFPEVFTNNASKRQGEYHPDVYSCGGMTLRDYFAAAAMTGLCANTAIVFGDHRAPEHPADCLNSISDAAYSVADAMLSERNKP